MKNRILMAILPVLVCFALLPGAQAGLSTPPDGCYPNFTTAEGCNALNSLTTGSGNTGLGWFALFGDSTGNFNTGVGAGALTLNTADSNTAVGAAALLLNTTGSENTAVGTDALVNNTVDGGNTAVGSFALSANIAGFLSVNGPNTAVGVDALAANTTGGGNIAVGAPVSPGGAGALGSNTIGTANTAMGQGALGANVDGVFNVAVGGAALFTNVSGSFNTAIGTQAGFSITGSGNIDIGHGVFGLATDSNTIRIGDNLNGAGLCFIGGITGVMGANFTDVVLLDPTTGQLGDLPSSAQYKKDIQPMDKTSEAIFSLRPVTFHYKNDKANAAQFGLIAEEVAKVNPALIGVDKEGKPHSVQYMKVDAMLLNEFLKEHKRVEEQQASISQLKSEMQTMVAQLKEQAAQIQKVSAQLQVNKPAPQVVVNKP